MLPTLSHLTVFALLLVALTSNAQTLSNARRDTTKGDTADPTRMEKTAGPPNEPQYKFKSFGVLEDIGCIKGNYQSSYFSNRWGCFVWNQAHQNNHHEGRCSYRQSGYPRVENGKMLEHDSEMLTKGDCIKWKYQLARGFQA